MNPIQAFKAILPYIETVDAKTETLKELLIAQTPVTQASFEEKFAEVKSRTHGKWGQLRTQVESILKDEELREISALDEAAINATRPRG